MSSSIGRMFRRTLAYLARPVLRFLLRRLPMPDPWERLSTRISYVAIAVGSRRDFAWYFEGESSVTVRSLEDIQRWLRRCGYASDMHLFQESDFWQHPRTFEHLRRGDCEDFSLWAWRKLVELGYDADLVVGRVRPKGEADPAGPWEQHAWIVFRQGGETYVYEPVDRNKSRAVQPLTAVRDQYIPEFGVGPDRRSFAFGGYLLTLQEQHHCHDRDGFRRSIP
jgi:hypothetical protein